MSNDVHVSRPRLKKISKAEVTSTRHCIARNNDHFQKEYRLDKKQPEDVNDYLFGSISPRTGQTNLLTMVGDLESPDHTQRDTTESDNNISSCSTLDIVNKVENISLQQLEKRVTELTRSLQEADRERVEMQRKLEECSAEKDTCLRRLEMISSAHECRITEMHCVIAELSKKLRTKQENTIMEEQEPEGSELSYQEEASIYNSELNLTNPDVECQTDPLDQCGHITFEGGEILVDDFEAIKYESVENLKVNEKDVNKAQIEALQEEVLQLKAQIAFLQSEIVESAGNYNKSQEIENDEKLEEKELCQGEADVECMDGNETTCSRDQKDCDMHPEDDQELNNLNIPFHHEAGTSERNLKQFPKKAERVKLNCVIKERSKNIDEMELLNEQFGNVNLIDSCQMEVVENNVLRSTMVEMSKKIEHLQLELEQSKLQCNMLSLSLEESKEHCDHLYLLCGKYESNAVALQTALNCSDRAIEAYDVMLALLESKLSLKNDQNEENLKAVEAVARHLLDRLESEKNICENSLGPWQNSFNIPDNILINPWTSEDDNRLRYHVSKLKGTRATVQNTIVNLESPFSDFYEKTRLTLNESNKEKAEMRDFAMSVMMNEMLQIREENLNLRNKIDDFEREKQLAFQRNNSIVEDTLQQLQLQIHQNNSLKWSPNGNLEDDHTAITEQQLVEALSRESALKSRIQALMAKNMSSDLDRGMRDLQKTNLNLEHQLEHSRRKYQSKIKKLEKKIQDISMGFSQDDDEYREKRFRNQIGSIEIPRNKTMNVPETTL